jgi:hypothetical protein
VPDVRSASVYRRGGSIRPLSSLMIIPLGGFFNDPIAHWYRDVFSHVPSTKVKLARAFRYDLSLLRRADPLVTLQPQC